MSDFYTVLRGAKLIDGAGSDPVQDSIVVIKGELIESVGRSGEVDYPQDADVIEVAGLTVMPGLIDAHLHLAGYPSLNSLQGVLDDPYLRCARAAMDCWRLLDSGFTTVRDCASYHTLFLRQAVDEGSLPGPRIVSCGKAVTQTCGHMDEAHSLPLEWVVGRDICRIADGPDECRRAVREQFRAGADFIKIATTGGVMSEQGAPTSTQYTVDEIKVITEEAHAMGKKVAAHAQGNQGIKNALLGGVDTIEHGIYLDDEAVEMMLDREAFLIPTLAVVEAILAGGPKAGIREVSLKKARSIGEDHLKSFNLAWRSGVKIGLGTDYFLSPLVIGEFMGNHAKELELYVRAGLSPLEAIVCATGNNAQALGLADSLGTIEAGKRADILVVRGDPLADITILQDRANIETVYKAGRPAQRLASATG